MRYRLCSLLIFSKKVQIYFASCVLGEDCTPHCHCLVPADYVDLTSGCELRNFRRAKVSSSSNIPRCKMLVRVAFAAHNSHTHLLVYLCFYLMCGNDDPLRTQNDHKQANSSAELHWRSNIHIKQNRVPVHLQFLSI